jgi:hypothetical protein
MGYERGISLSTARFASLLGVVWTVGKGMIALQGVCDRQVAAVWSLTQTFREEFNPSFATV